MQEEWKDIKGYEGLYQISNLGNVRSLDRIVKDSNRERYQRIKGHYMKPTDNGNGYKIISLLKNYKRKNHYIHRLVAQHFIDNPNNYREVNHIDCNKSNNKITNLEWCNSSQNKIHYLNTELGKEKNKKASETRFKNLVKNKEKQIIDMYIKDYKTIRKISSIVNLHESTVKKVLILNNIPIRYNIKIFDKYKILRLNEKGHILEKYNNYEDICSFIIKNNLSNAKKETIKSEIYDAITLRRNNNKKYGFYWVKSVNE